MARSLMTEPNEVCLGFLRRQLAREKNLLFYFWRLGDTTVIFLWDSLSASLNFSQPWQFSIVYHIGRKKGGIHLMIEQQSMRFIKLNRAFLLKHLICVPEHLFVHLVFVSWIQWDSTECLSCVYYRLVSLFLTKSRIWSTM